MFCLIKLRFSQRTVRKVIPSIASPRPPSIPSPSHSSMITFFPDEQKISQSKTFFFFHNVKSLFSLLCLHSPPTSTFLPVFLWGRCWWEKKMLCAWIILEYNNVIFHLHAHTNTLAGHRKRALSAKYCPYSLAT